MNRSPLCMSWVRTRPANVPPTHKKTTDVTKYMIAIFLWSVVVSQSRTVAR